MTHTPGPWEIEENEYGDEINVYPLKDGPPPIGRWAEICTVKDYESQDEMRDNAALISAAPDLLEALRELFATVQGECPRLLDEDRGANPHLYSSIVDAIAKAEGR